ncbi:Uma2 family endonuclease [Kamptonema sp. UHCC 0994]|uniref:Uma2 family endonuclease n=1 Tax=Kamptonema sp. UHCC 0994 TaxID=3031329 RepID=UPI0023B88DF9|nr:Uma2 family endonuclease [Kamptonema sp. UHCC 0994]MDF0555589.1 Uma2 family endonuclease [Kamptonema sp. UHCC 0994]
MVQFNQETRLPTSAELPSSDDTPVDNENQNFLPNLLLFLLKFHWSKRNDWFFGVDMGVYHTTGVSHLVPIIPDGFLSLGVERFKGDTLRLSYVLWEENNIPPIFALEVVSQTYGGEYDKKMDIYAGLGVLYYVIYNPYYWRRDLHQTFEVYRLVDGEYELQIGEPFWMPEVGLGIGRGRYQDGAKQLEVLYWFDERGSRYLTAEEKAEQAEERLNRYRQQFGELP